MSGFKNVNINPSSISMDAGSRLRVSQMTTLFDGKILNVDNGYMFDTQGTGTSAYTDNKLGMTATTGQYLVRQGKRFNSYSAGKSQIVECTFNGFWLEAGVTKKVGYFSSSAVAPYSAATDGFYLENDGTTYRLKAEHTGVVTVDVPWTSWDNYAMVSGYSWNNFTVIAFDFLWLGGAILRIFLKTNDGFILAHTVNYAGSAVDTFIHSPNQPVRYEIRSTGGTGSFNYICCQVSTEGSVGESGYNIGVQSLNTAAVASNTCATIGTTYPLKGVRKKVANRDNSVKITGAQVMVASTSDIVYWTLNLNPTLSAPLTYTDVTADGIQEANGSAVAAISITVTNPGRILASGIVSVNSIMPTGLFDTDFLSYLGSKLDNTMDEIVLCVTPITAGVTVNGVINLKTF